MRRLTKPSDWLILLLCGLFLGGASIAQETETAEQDEPAAEAEESAAAAEDEEEIVVDDGSYIDAEDDDFKPSEEISADRSITFPTDI